MRAVAMFPKEKAIRVVDRPAPKIERDRQIRLRMLEVGVCGTDHEIARFEYGTPPEGEPYLVMGHESLAEVVEVRNGSRFKPGDLVVTTVRRPCGQPECRPCHHDRPDFCVTGAYTERGIKGRHGFMTDEVIDDDKNMHLVPPALADVAVLTEPLTIAEKGLLELDSVLRRMPWIDPARAERKGLNAVVLGAGPVGLLGALAFLVRGMDTWVYSRESASSERAKWVEAVGARYICADECRVGNLSSRIKSVDLIYEATGSAALAFAAMGSMGPNAIFIFTGVPGHRTPIEFDGETVMRNLVLRNQLLYGTVNAGPPAFEASIADLGKFLERWPEQTRALITGHFPPEKITEVLAGRPGAIKDVIRFGTPSAKR